MFAKNRSAPLAAVLALVVGTSATGADDVVVQPNGTVVKPMPKRKQRKLERKIQKLTGGDVVVEGTPVVPVRPNRFLKPIQPRREVRVVTPGPAPRIIEGPAPIVTNTPIPADSTTSSSNRPIYSNSKPSISRTPIITETPVSIGTPIVSTPSAPSGTVSAPVTGPDSSVNPAKGADPVPAPAEVIPPPVEVVPPPVEPALEPVKAPRDSA